MTDWSKYGSYCPVCDSRDDYGMPCVSVNEPFHELSRPHAGRWTRHHEETWELVDGLLCAMGELLFDRPLQTEMAYVEKADAWLKENTDFYDDKTHAYFVIKALRERFTERQTEDEPEIVDHRGNALTDEQLEWLKQREPEQQEESHA